MADALALPLIADARDAAGQLVELRTSSVERACVLYLDPKRRLLGRADFVGTPNRVAPSFRAILAEALRLDAAALVLAHSHPDGDSDPSASDIAFTRALIRLAAALDIVVVDHLIVAGDTMLSLRGAGLM